MKNAFEGLAGNEERIAEVLRAGEYFWLDLDVTEPGVERMEEVLGVPEHARAVLFDFASEETLPRRFYADDEHVVFPFLCIRRADAPVEDVDAFEPLEVRVLVHGTYVVTAHRGPCEPLAHLIGQALPQKRTERYLVYAVLEEMVVSIFEALENVESAIEEVEDETELSGRRQSSRAIRGARARLIRLRRRVGPHVAVFERVSEEIEQVTGLESDERKYFEQISGQLRRVVTGIDAASDSLSTLLELRLNATIYRLTLIATIFLPLTFVTGFFGMNFGWLVDNIDTAAAFLVFGLGGLGLLGIGTWLVINRQAPGPETEPPSPASRRR
jgi:magnesium transporter